MDKVGTGKFKFLLDVIQTLFLNIFRISQYIVLKVYNVHHWIQRLKLESSLSQGGIGINDRKDQSDQPVNLTLSHRLGFGTEPTN